MFSYFISEIRRSGSSDFGDNLKRQWFFALSAMCFLLLNAGSDIFYYYSVIAASVIFIVIACVPVYDIVRASYKYRRAVELFSLINSVCICISTCLILMHYPFLWGVDPVLRISLSVLSVPAVYALNLFFWNELMHLLRIVFIDSRISRKEMFFYLFLFGVTAVYAAYAYCNSTAFYDQNVGFDIIYTSDSPILVNRYSFNLIDSMNSDIRQPLSGVFSIPFMGIAYIISQIIPIIPSALIIDCICIMILLVANIMIAAQLKFSAQQRVCFMILTCSMYTYLLFSIMIEQYILAYFWLALTICLYCKEKDEAAFSVLAAAGTLLTSGILFPLVATVNATSVKKWISKMFTSAVDFFVLLIALGRLNILLLMDNNIMGLTVYTGTSLSFSDRLLQYINFVSSCFVAPGSMGEERNNVWSWQMEPVTRISYVGIAIIFFAILGFILNRKDKLAQVAFIWVLFSFFVLAVVGWGTSENGLVLYSLYFGWAFVVLIVNLILKLEKLLRAKYFWWTTSVIASIVMLSLNIRSVFEMLFFLFEHYPV